MGQFSMEISCVAGSVLSGNQQGFNAKDFERLDELREFIETVKIADKSGVDFRPMIRAFGDGSTSSEAAAIGEVASGDGFTWEQVRDQFLEFSGENKERDTTRGYRSALGKASLSADFQPIIGMPIKNIRTKHLAEIRENIICRIQATRGKGTGISQANLSVAAIRSCFDWAINTPRFDLEFNPASDLAKCAEKRKKREKVDRPLTDMEIGALFDELLSMNNRSAARALTLQLMTGQRRLTALKARKAAFNFGEDGYDIVWDFEDKVMLSVAFLFLQ